MDLVQAPLVSAVSLRFALHYDDNDDKYEKDDKDDKDAKDDMRDDYASLALKMVS